MIIPRTIPEIIAVLVIAAILGGICVHFGG